MREENLKAIRARAFKPKTTDSKGTQAAPNLLAQVAPHDEVSAGRIIIGDITYIRLRGGKFCYLAGRQNKTTRRIIGWSLSAEMTAELMISALEKTIRKGKVKPEAIIHSDRGSQYVTNAFRALLAKNALRQSMSGKGNCYGNAQAESFFSRFKAELIENGGWKLREMIFAHPARNKLNKREPEQKTQICPEDFAVDLMRGLQEMMEIVPVNAR